MCCDSVQCMWGDRIDVRLLGLFQALALHVDEEVARRRIALMLAGLRCQNLLEDMTPVLKVKAERCAVVNALAAFAASTLCDCLRSAHVVQQQ